MEHTELRSLFIKYLEGKLTPAEYEKLSEAAQTHTVNDWQEALTPLIENKETIETFDEQEWKDEIEYIFNQPAIKPAKIILISRWFRHIAIAASILLAISAGTYFLFFNKPVKETEIAKVPGVDKDVAAPAANRAMIILANGRKIYLDSVNNGILAAQGNVRLIKLANGEITYQAEKDSDSYRYPIEKMIYNTLTNPRGSLVATMILADGSKIWLNAGSSVTYPVAFVGNERKVSITGEAYFEVTRNTAMPFKVALPSSGGAGGGEVTVLGTHFNVNAYEEESDIKVTLLEGVVKVSKGKATGLLKPGQQARVINEVKVVDDVDVEQVMAWKNGKFDFREGTELKDIMRQIARWYDVDIEYKGNVNQSFGGSISRQVNVSKVLEKFELTERVHFKIEGKKIIVLQ